MFLDTLVSDGIPGIVVLIAWIALAFTAGRGALRGEHRLLSATLLAGLVGTLVAHQFVVLMIPTAFLFLLSLGLLTALEKRETGDRFRPTFAKAAAMGWAFASILLVACAYQLAGSDLHLARVQRLLDAGDPETAAVASNAAQLDRHAVFMPGISADVYFSRRWSAASASSSALAAKVQFAQLAANAAVAATQVPEQQANAWYSLAMLQAAANNPHAVETSLRAAIYLSPTWFKPHWSLARLLHAAGHVEEARQEARLALDLDGNRDREVIDTTAEILRSATAAR
jgi:tetratricopeptide (TPR) repeat protein